ncbi:hypothetical protein ACFQER_11770 [Halomicroarcula sp. GCM10025894]|uniref:hypothetical protein n=1 Tax=Halomicroarcula sp. GCM10025894 TaxID=3252673 RepID=UPI00360C91A1
MTGSPRSRFDPRVRERVHRGQRRPRADGHRYRLLRQRPGRLTTGGTQNNADPRLTTGSPGDHPFFPSRPLEKDLRDPDGDETEE